MHMSDGSIAVIDNSRKAVYGYDQRAEVFGSKGMAATKNDSASTCVISSENGIVSEKPLYFFLERYMDSFAAEGNKNRNRCRIKSCSYSTCRKFIYKGKKSCLYK